MRAKMTKAVSCLRVSGKGQVEGDGFDGQRHAVARYAKTARFKLVDEYRDEGVSGTKDLESRPGLAALLDRVESNGAKFVIVERADRLARHLMVSAAANDSCDGASPPAGGRIRYRTKASSLVQGLA